MILFYPSTLPGEPLECHDVHGMTVEQWLIDNVRGYEHRDEPPIAITIAGQKDPIPPHEWCNAWIGENTVVEIRPQPKEPATIIYAVVAAVVAVAASLLLRPSIPGQSNRSSARGAQLLEANATGNTVKLGDVIPEIAGRFRRYPDYLNAPRRRFVEPKVQALDLLLCVGIGQYAELEDYLAVGNTPVTQLGEAVSFQFFGPGEDVSGHPAHLNWYNAPEVGPSVGASGIRLRSNRDADSSWDGTLAFNGNQITSPDEAPTGWGAEIIIDVDIPIEVTITDGAGSDHDEIAGAFDYLMLEPGITFTIDQYPDDLFRVNTYTGGVLTMDLFIPGSGWVVVNGLTPGNETWQIIRANLDYRVINVITDGFEVEARVDGTPQPSWLGFPNITTTEATVLLSEGELTGIWTLPFAACPRGEVTSHIEIDVFGPQGLVEMGETSGNLYLYGVDIEFRYRPVGSTDDWTVVSQRVEGQTRDQLGWTFPVDLIEPMRPEVQVRRVQAEANRVQVSDRLEWYGLRARVDNAPTSYEGVTVLAMTITGSDLISSQTENQVSLIPTRMLPCRENGQWTALQPTRDIAPWVGYISKSAGYTDDDIDLDELDRLDAVWKARGDKFDFIEADESTVKDALIRVLRAGMAEPTISGGMITPVRDEPKQQVEHVYSAQNFTKEFSFSIRMPRPDDSDGIDVEYIDGETWAKGEVKCRLPGDQGFKVEKKRLDGVISRKQAYQIGMRERSAQEYRRADYGWGTELDALNSRYMGYDAIISDVPGEGQSMLCEYVGVINANRVFLQVTEPLDWSADEPHVVAWRRPNGTMSGPYDAEPGAYEYEVVMVSSAGVEAPTIDDTMEPPHVYFGPVSTFMHRTLVTSIQPRGFESVNVSAVEYDERVYLYDDSLPTE